MIGLFCASARYHYKWRPFLLPCAPDGLHQPLYGRFLTLQESGLERVVAGRFDLAIGLFATHLNALAYHEFLVKLNDNPLV